MLVLISPAKIQNFKPQSVTEQYTLPEFLKQSEQLIQLIKGLSISELAKLLDINSSLTQLNIDRYFNWHLPFSPQNAKQAVLTFDGEAFRGLNAKTFSSDDFDYAQSHLRILSGLYGVLRPLDLIQPYRIDVSSKLRNPKGSDLYAFWKEKVSASVLKAMRNGDKQEFILNLMSKEYLKTLDLKHKKVKIIDVEFYEMKDDQYKQIVIYTKKARGLMAQYVIKNRIEDIEDLKGFSAENYWFSPQMSTDSKLVFTRG